MTNKWASHLRLALLGASITQAACSTDPYDISAEDELPAAWSPKPEASSADGSSASGSRCSETWTRVRCEKRTASIRMRQVHWQVPTGLPPERGWPVAILFQGSFFSAAWAWDANVDTPFASYYQTLTIERLLEHGFAVLAPETRAFGLTFWDTNIMPFTNDWEDSPDHRFMLDIFSAIDDGTFGPLDGKRLYAAGISSGGYMTSRMAVAYPGRFAALAVHSGSYATCAGLACTIPPLDASHPPTLFLHGRADWLVPVSTAEHYRDALTAARVESRIVIDDHAGHEWIAAAPDAVTGWFVEHDRARADRPRRKSR